jgi:hypothetical protein
VEEVEEEEREMDLSSFAIPFERGPTAKISSFPFRTERKEEKEWLNSRILSRREVEEEESLSSSPCSLKRRGRFPPEGKKKVCWEKAL